ncbi:hypothetical protein WJX73_002842 [Symbiochloris irregularis]|uniref:DUF3456 domain-containing protein n=1 Tax=Symbiochloris irregularis TaxID=706552 RepID=A0AAW1PLA7_9CHLO
MMLLQACAPGDAIAAPCSACLSLSNELHKRVTQEIPRGKIDLRHRLDEKGNRYGPVLDYRSSEMRVDRLLDGLCKLLSKYHLGAEGQKRNLDG